MIRPSLPRGYVDMAALVGKRRVTHAMAERNRRRHIAPMLERPPVRGLVNLDAAGIWAAIASGEFPAPIRTRGGLAWDAYKVHLWNRRTNK